MGLTDMAKDKHGREFRDGCLFWRWGTKSLYRFLQTEDALFSLVHGFKLKGVSASAHLVQQGDAYEILAYGLSGDPIPGQFKPERDAEGRPVLCDFQCIDCKRYPRTEEIAGLRGMSAWRCEECGPIATARHLIDKKIDIRYPCGTCVNVGDSVYAHALGKALVTDLRPTNAHGNTVMIEYYDGGQVAMAPQYLTLISREPPPHAAKKIEILVADLRPSAKELESIFEARVVRLHDKSPWSTSISSNLWAAVLYRGADVRVLTLTRDEIEKKSGELEPSLPRGLRQAQAFRALCIEKAKTFWGGTR